MASKKNPITEVTPFGIPWKAEQHGKDGAYSLRAEVDFNRVLLPIRDWSHVGANPTKAVMDKLEGEAFKVIMSLTENERVNSTYFVEGKERAKMVVHDDGTKTAEIVKAKDRGTSVQRVRGEVHITGNMVIAQCAHAALHFGPERSAQMLVRWCSVLGIEIENSAS